MRKVKTAFSLVLFMMLVWVVPASAVQTGVDWSSTTAGSLDGTTYSFTVGSGSTSALATSDFATGTFSALPLGASQEAIAISHNGSTGFLWVVSFNAPHPAGTELFVYMSGLHDNLFSINTLGPTEVTTSIVAQSGGVSIPFPNRFQVLAANTSIIIKVVLPANTTGFNFVAHAGGNPPYNYDITFAKDVVPVNLAPVAVDDLLVEGYFTPCETNLFLDEPLNNDFDPEGDSFSVHTVTPLVGNSSFVDDGTAIEFVPNPGFSGVATLNYTLMDDPGNVSNTALVEVTVGPCNSPPVGNPDNWVGTEDTALMVAAPGGLANDTDPDGDTIFASDTTAPANGVLSNFFADGSFTYTPNTNFCGQDAWTYRPTDNIDQGNVTNVTIDVSCTNLPPVANNDSFQTGQDTVFMVFAPGALANDTDPDPEDFLNAANTTQPTNGVLSNFFADGSFTYTPNPGYCGPDSWTYQAIDGIEGTFGRLYSNVATVDMFVVCTDPASAIAFTQALLDDLLAGGDLSQHNYDKLDKKLDKIADKLAKGDTVAACNQADAAISQTGDMLAQGDITQQVHDDIVFAFNAIKATIPC